MPQRVAGKGGIGGALSKLKALSSSPRPALPSAERPAAAPAVPRADSSPQTGSAADLSDAETLARLEAALQLGGSVAPTAKAGAPPVGQKAVGSAASRLAKLRKVPPKTEPAGEEEKTEGVRELQKESG